TNRDIADPEGEMRHEPGHNPPEPRSSQATPVAGAPSVRPAAGPIILRGVITEEWMRPLACLLGFLTVASGCGTPPNQRVLNRTSTYLRAGERAHPFLR